MIDNWQAYRGGWDLSVFEGQSGADVIAVELAHARREPQGTLLEDTINDRKYCGEGDADIPTFIAAMMRAGFGGFWVLKCCRASIGRRRSRPPWNASATPRWSRSSALALDPPKSFQMRTHNA